MSPIPTDHPVFDEAQAEVDDEVSATSRRQGQRERSTGSTVELGKIMWDYCGMERSDPGLEKAISEIPALREEFWRNVLVPGDEGVNQSLEKAGRVTDFFGLAELMCRDAFEREESCGGHFQVEYQTEEGEALRNDVTCAHVSAWMFAGEDAEPSPGSRSPSSSSTSSSPNGATSEKKYLVRWGYVTR